MSQPSSPSWSGSEEFHCKSCGAHQAFRSRPRSFFERYLLPLLMLQTVRCERCFHRSYILRKIAVHDKPQSEHKPSRSAATDTSKDVGREGSEGSGKGSATGARVA